MTILMLYLLSGLVAGFLAGLLGIGGGLVLVPVLVLLFDMQGFPERAIMPLALGTSLATIVFTSISSMYAHHAKGAVDWRTLTRMTPGIVAGALVSTGSQRTSGRGRSSSSSRPTRDWRRRSLSSMPSHRRQGSCRGRAGSRRPVDW